MTRLGELTRKVDAFFARVAERHGADMQCQTGCSDCCHVQLTLTAVEAAAIRAHVAAWPAAQRRALSSPGPDPAPRRAGPALGAACAALDAGGRCKIYEARPLVCRSHGVPIRLRRGALPVVEACHRNFTHTAPDADCVLDQATLSATLFAVDAAERRADPSAGPSADPSGDPGPQRVELAGLLAELAAI